MEKVFDTVDHNIFLDKIAIYGIKGTVHRRLESYLSNRKQLCEWKTTKSFKNENRHTSRFWSVRAIIVVLNLHQ
jgi:hypothetical protein